VRRLILGALLTWTAACRPSGSTTFAPGFTEAAFGRVKAGMTKEEVLELLGPPISTAPNATGRCGDSIRTPLRRMSALQR
jgi:outer membrane protein assembly factor BamE (lipoprotein component of BamABCDE complex)